MLSYRHAFHAGNHADILKHAVISLLIDQLKQKDKPFCYLDTHSGGGCYDLTGEWANKKPNISMVLHAFGRNAINGLH